MKIPSFKAGRKLNTWYGLHSTKFELIITFAALYSDFNINNFLLKKNCDLFFHWMLFTLQNYLLKYFENVPEKLIIKFIFSFVSWRYFRERKNPFEVAKKYYHQIIYKLNNKDCFGIGFKNDSGGYEIRNSHTKISSSPKGYNHDQ